MTIKALFKTPFFNAVVTLIYTNRRKKRGSDSTAEAAFSVMNTLKATKTEGSAPHILQVCCRFPVITSMAGHVISK